MHHHLKASSLKPDSVLHNHILNMYGKCGSLKDARNVFEEMPHPNVVSWTSMIAGCSQNGQGDEAMTLYLRMQQSGHLPDQFTFGSIIKACSGLGDVALGRQLHTHVLKSKAGCHLIPQNALIAMYSKFDSIREALQVFSQIVVKDLISWSSIIAGLSKLGYEMEALCWFREMLRQGVFQYQPNEFIFGSLFCVCGTLVEPEYGRQVHAMSVKFGMGGEVFSGSSLTNMYAKCNSLDSARMAFNQIERPDLVSWNAIIAVSACAGETDEAVAYLMQMRRLGLVPDGITFCSLLCAFSNPIILYQGKLIHSCVVKMGFHLDVSVCNTLLTMYSKCSDLGEVFNMFHDIRENANIVSWNALLTACLQHKYAMEVFRLFKLMHNVNEHRPDNVTLGNLVGASAEISSLEMGKQVHCCCIKTGLEMGFKVTNALIDMYTKCGSLESAHLLFDSMGNPDVVSWSSLIVGYAQFGHGEEALNLFETMMRLGVKPNQVTLVGVLTACSHAGQVKEGWRIYETMEREHGIIPTREHCNIVVDLLARAGCLTEAENFITQKVPNPDIVIWKTLLAACKKHNNVEIGERAAENILRIDPTNSTAHVLLCSIYASNSSWEDFARVRSSMRQCGVWKVPGQSWIEDTGGNHVFSGEDCLHPERSRIYRTLEELWLQMSDDCYIMPREEVFE